MSHTCPRVTLVVPTYMEAENIGPFLRGARSTVGDARIIVCDDNSPDGTGAIAEEMAVGLGNIVQMGVDLSHPHALLPDMIKRIEAGAEVVIGARYMPGGAYRAAALETTGAIGGRLVSAGAGGTLPSTPKTPTVSAPA
jgi:glycosyltransferase involved in cell wall biosynthesis